eukprot:752874-Hanusia_phi.AAC.1
MSSTRGLPSPPALLLLLLLLPAPPSLPSDLMSSYPCVENLFEVVQCTYLPQCLSCASYAREACPRFVAPSLEPPHESMVGRPMHPCKHLLSLFLSYTSLTQTLSHSFLDENWARPHSATVRRKAESIAFCNIADKLTIQDEQSRRKHGWHLDDPEYDIVHIMTYMRQRVELATRSKSIAADCFPVVQLECLPHGIFPRLRRDEVGGGRVVPSSV